MSASDNRLWRASRIYEGFLRLYPRVHREKYGPLMTQFFRDQWRAARPGSARALLKLSLGTFVDLAFSAFREHLSNQLHTMKNISPNRLSLILFIVSIGTALLTVNFMSGQVGIALGLAYFSALALLLRAIVEWSRPPNELIRSLVWAATIAVIFGFVFPVWARIKLPIIPWLILTPVLLNALVPMIKVGQRFATPRP